MTKIDLITGFLGSGKTTFIQKYVDYLLSIHEKIGIIENDYGAINVDMLLLNDLKKKGVGLEMVSGGCDYDCHRRRFKTKLLTMSLLGYDRVIVEPSGVFDVDEFFDLLHEEGLDGRYAIGNVLTVVRADLEEDLSDRADYVLGCQIADAGRIILSFTENTEKEDISKTKAHLRKALDLISCPKILNDDLFIEKSFDDLDEDDFKKIVSSSYLETAYVKKYDIDTLGFDSLFYMNPEGENSKILSSIEKIWKDEGVGNIWRIKGFLKEEDHWLKINSTKTQTKISPSNIGQSVLIVIGEDLDAEKIEVYFPSQYSSLHTQ